MSIRIISQKEQLAWSAQPYDLTTRNVYARFIMSPNYFFFFAMHFFKQSGFCSCIIKRLKYDTLQYFSHYGLLSWLLCKNGFCIRDFLFLIWFCPLTRIIGGWHFTLVQCSIKLKEKHFFLPPSSSISRRWLHWLTFEAK